MRHRSRGVVENRYDTCRRGKGSRPHMSTTRHGSAADSQDRSSQHGPGLLAARPSASWPRVCIFTASSTATSRLCPAAGHVVEFRSLPGPDLRFSNVAPMLVHEGGVHNPEKPRIRSRIWAAASSPERRVTPRQVSISKAASSGDPGLSIFDRVAAWVLTTETESYLPKRGAP